MKIVMVTFGSRGDIQPFAALSLFLKQAGHETVLCGPPEYGPVAEKYGCSYHPGTMAFTRAMELINNWSCSPLEFHYLKSYTKIIRQYTRECFDSLPGIIRNADLVLGSFVISSVHTLAEFYGKPYCCIALCPQSLPSSYHPSPYMPNYYFSRAFMRFTWWGMQISDNIMLRKTLNEKRRELGLKPVKDVYRHKLGNKVILATDEILGAIPPDVDRECIQTGYPQIEQNDILSAEIEKFLESGPRPIYIGFGSMPNSNPVLMSKLFLDAALSLDQRVIVFRGAAGLFNVANDKRVLVIDEAPHTKLFPQLSLVVHHGGAGTTATAARSGVPQVIMPHIYDQFYWARQVRNLGIGRYTGFNEKLTIESITRAINDCLTDESIAARAREVAEELNHRDSFKAILDFIESNFSDISRAPETTGSTIDIRP